MSAWKWTVISLFLRSTNVEGLTRLAYSRVKVRLTTSSALKRLSIRTVRWSDHWLTSSILRNSRNPVEQSCSNRSSDTDRCRLETADVTRNFIWSDRYPFPISVEVCTYVQEERVCSFRPHPVGCSRLFSRRSDWRETSVDVDRQFCSARRTSR